MKMLIWYSLLLLIFPIYPIVGDSGLASQQKEEHTIVRGCEGWGFFAEFLWALNYLEYCTTTHITPCIYWGPDFAYYAQAGYNGSLNCWEYYFEPVSHHTYVFGDTVTLNRWYSQTFSALWNYDQYIDNVPVCTAEEKKDFIYVTQATFPYAGKYPEGGNHLYSKSFRRYIKYEILDRYVVIKQPIFEKIMSFYHEHMMHKKTIGIHLRGRHMYGEVPFVSIDDLFAQANKHAGPGVQFFVATDQTGLLTLAQQLLNGPVISYESARFDVSTAPVAGGKKNDPVLGENLVIEMRLLSLCQHLIHTISNVSTAVLYFNPELGHTVLY